MAEPPSKSERMELRRAIGNREVPGPHVPPYHRGPDYLVAHACFDCRKSWKIELREDHQAVCPECGGVLHEMGRNFKAPKKRDDEQWKKVRALWSAGVRFWGYNVGEPPPQRLSEVEDYLRSRRQRR